MTTYQSLVTDGFGRPDTAYSSGASTNNLTVLGNNWNAVDARFAHLAGGIATLLKAQTAQFYRSPSEAVSLNSQVALTVPAGVFDDPPIIYVTPRAVGATQHWYGVRFRLSAGNLLLDWWHGVGGGGKNQTNVGSTTGTASIAYNSGHIYTVTTSVTGTTSLAGSAFITDVTAATNSGTVSSTLTSPEADIQVAATIGVIVTSATLTDTKISQIITYYDNANALTLSASSLAVAGANTTLTTAETPATLGTLATTLYNGATTVIAAQTGSGTASGNVTLAPGGSTGGVLLIDGSSGAAAYLNVTTISITPSPTTLAANLTSATLTITGNGTSWAGGTTPISASGGGPITITGQVVNSLGSITLTVNTGASAGTTTLTDATTGKQCFVGVTQAYAVDVAGGFFSPGNWRISAGTFAQSANAGAYVRFACPGSALSVTIDMSGYTGAGLATYPTVMWTVDDGAPTFLTLGSGTTSITLYSNLNPATTHQVFFIIDAVPTNTGFSKWGTAGVPPVPVVKITGWSADGTPTTPTLRAKRLLVLGDSRTQGNIVFPANSNTATGSFVQSYVMALADALGAEFCAVGWSSQDWVIGGIDSVPAFHNGAGVKTWDKIDFDTARTLSGLDYALINEGTNGDIQFIATATEQAAITNFLPAFRTAIGGTTKAFILVPFGQRIRTAIVNAYNAYKAADSSFYLIDPPARLGMGPVPPNGPNPYGTNTAESGDATHGRVTEYAYEATVIAQAMQAALNPAGGGGGSSNSAWIGI